MTTSEDIGNTVSYGKHDLREALVCSISAFHGINLKFIGTDIILEALWECIFPSTSSKILFVVRGKLFWSAVHLSHDKEYNMSSIRPLCRCEIEVSGQAVTLYINNI